MSTPSARKQREMHAGTQFPLSFVLSPWDGTTSTKRAFPLQGMRLQAHGGVSLKWFQIQSSQRWTLAVIVLCGAMVDRCHCTLVQAQKKHSTKTEPHGPGDCLCNRSGVTHVPPWWRVLVIGKATHVWRERTCGNLFSLCSILLSI